MIWLSSHVSKYWRRRYIGDFNSYFGSLAFILNKNLLKINIITIDWPLVYEGRT